MLWESGNRWGKRLSILLTLVVLTVTLLRHASVQAQAETYTENFQFPFDVSQFVPCANDGAGEDVELSGILHMMLHVTLDDSGGFHAVVHSELQQVSGTGMTTGDRYQQTSAFQVELNGKVGSTFNIVNNFRIIGQGPGNNFLVHENAHITITPDGDMTVFFENISNECQ